jgi:hypothetical protein
MRRTLSGLDTNRSDLGFLSPTIREWGHEMKAKSTPGGTSASAEVELTKSPVRCVRTYFVLADVPCEQRLLPCD